MLISISPVIAAEMPPLPNPDVMSKEYWALWNDDVQAKIDERIETHRKANATVFLIDVKPGTEVRIEQISHEFLFGANIFNFNQLGSKELDDKYKAIFGELLNSATIPFYWTQHEMDRGTVRYKTCAEDNPEFWAKIHSEGKDPTQERFWRRPATDQIVEFCEQKGIFRHGHTLIWHSRGDGLPTWMKKNSEDVPEMEKLFEARLLEIAKQYGDRINRWDVVNESRVDPSNPHHPKHDPNNPALGPFGVMPIDYTYKVFKYAEQVFPNNVALSINDHMNGPDYFDQVGYLRLRGCRIDVVGVQMHLNHFYGNWPEIVKGAKIEHPEYILNVMDRFDKLGIPLHMSEITIPATSNDETGWQVQANIARNLYRMWFSLPKIEAITWWNLVDGCNHPNDPSTAGQGMQGICTRQLEKKPAYHALDRLINHEWKTNIVQKADAERMLIAFRGFKGKYKVSWIDKGNNAQTAEMVVN
jgi:GH35 family endo-1,4-beta-xylanase